MSTNPQPGGPGAGSGPGTALSAPVVHPHSGEVLGATHAELEQLPGATLAEVHLAIREREGDLSRMRKEVEGELMRRLELRGRRRMLVDDFEVSYEPSRSREWDPVELEHELHRLVDEGVVSAGELTGLITTPTVVDKRKAQRLLSRLAGEARQAVESCFTWVDGRRNLSVVRSAPLVPDDEPSQR